MLPRERFRLIGRVVLWFALGGIFLVILAVYFSGLAARRNVQRLKDVQTITVALHQYAADHAGTYPDGLDAEEKQIGSAVTGCAVKTAQCAVKATNDCLNLTPALSPYLKDMPTDPKSGSDARTRYSVRLERGGRLLVTACDYTE